MQISSVMTPTFTNVSNDDGSDASLTPDDLFAYCESQMNDIDGQVDGYFSQEENNDKIKSDLNDVISAVRQLEVEAGNQTNGATNDPTAVNAIQSQLQAIAAEYPAGAQQINDAISTLTTDGKSDGNTDTTVSTSDTESIINTLSGVGDQLDSDNQMQMIKLQSAMSQREQAVELTTNILQTVDDSATKVVANIHS